jgi:hypothetical protein
VTQIALTSLLATALAILIAYLFIRRSRVFLGLLLGILPIGLMEVLYHWRLEISLRKCIDSACAAAGLPPGCEMAAFGCTEWSGLTVFVFYLAGLLSLAIYIIGAGAMAILHSASKRKAQAAALDPDRSG